MIIRVSYDGLTTGSYTSYECQCEDHGPLDGNKTHQTRVHLHIRFGESWARRCALSKPAYSHFTELRISKIIHAAF